MRFLRILLLFISFFAASNSALGSFSDLYNPQLFSKIDSLNNLSYNSRRTNPRKSLEDASKAVEICKNVDYPKGYAFAIHNRGVAKTFLGRYDAGLSDLMEASSLREKLNDSEGLAVTYNALGFVFAEMGNDKKALEFYEQSLAQRAKTNYKVNMGIVLNNIGWVHFRSGQLDKALELFYQALNANQEEGDDRGVGASQSNIGSVYRRIGDYKKGLEYHFKALETGRKFEDKYGVINTLRFIAEDYLELGQIENSTEYALRSFLMAQEIGSLGEEKNSAVLLAQIYEQRKEYSRVAKYLKIVSSLKDSLFSIEKAEVLGHMQTVFDLEAKEKENDLLRIAQNVNAQKIRMQRYFLLLSLFFVAFTLVLSALIFLFNRKLKLANVRLSELNQEINNQKEVIEHKVQALDGKNFELLESNQIKDKLISVIAHDLKNPLNSVSGYSEIIISRFESYSKDEIISFLRIIHENAIRSNMLLDNLLQWSRLQTRTLPFLPTKQKISKLVYDELYFVINVAAEKKVSIKTQIEENLYIRADVNMLKTIVRNLLSNAIKFSRKGGEIIVSAQNRGDEILVMVKDNGLGIAPSIKTKLFSGEAGISTSGTAGEKGTGLGLMLCKDFVEAHGGRIWVDSELDTGSTFSFILPNIELDEN